LKEKEIIKKIKTLLLTIVIFLLIILNFSPENSMSIKSYGMDLKEILSYINSPSFIYNIMEHVRKLSSLGSRVTGQNGFYKAADYIADKFKEYGLKPGGDKGYFELFNITVPVDQDVRIVVPEANIIVKGYALWPNGIQACYTPPEGIEGTLVYFKDGSLEEISETLRSLNLEDLSDIIALMEFNTYKGWLNLANFKVKAIIFLEPESTNRIEAETKFSMTPLLIPRIYVSASDSQALLENIHKKVKIYSDMRYKNVESVNIFGIIEGAQYKNDVIVVSSYFDSWSIVPRLSPGADEATGVAVLLELARFFSANKPLRTIWFVAFSGHWQALRGSRYFVEKHYFAPGVQNDTVKIWVHFNLDFSTDSSTVAWIHYGSMWIQDKVSGLFDYMFTFIEGDVYKSLTIAGFNVSKHVDRHQMPNMQGYFIHDAEPSVVAGIAGFSFRTSRSMRLQWGTPFDTLEKVNFENLMPQATFALSCIYMTSNVESLGLQWGTDNVKPVRRYMRSGGGYPGRKGYAGIYGDVVRFEPETRWYTSEGLENYDIILDVTISPSRYNPFTHTILKLESDISLNFRVEGIGTDYVFPETGYGAHYVGAGEPGVPAVRVYAYALNRTTGRIEWAPDMGIWAWPQNLGFTTDREDGWKDVRVSLFKCETVTLTNIIDPLKFEEPWVDVNWYLSTFDRFARTSDMSTRFMTTINLEIMDFNTHGSFLQWGMLTPQESGEPFALIFLPTDSRFEVILRSGGSVIGVLINASREYNEGVGFKVSGNLYIDLPFQVANDLFWLNEKRFNIIANYKAYSMWALTVYQKSQEYYSAMKEAFSEKDYSSILGLSLLAWSWSIRAYQEFVNLINGLTYTFIFFSSLLVPFAFLVERLLIQSEGLKRLFYIILFYAISFVTLSFFHPGFEIALSTPLAVMAFVQIVMSIITLSLLTGVTGGYLKEFRSKVRGLHFAEISRTGAALLAASLGIQQMRRRKLRTCLTLATVTIISFTLVLLTSVTGGITVKSAATLEGASYEGSLINSNLGIEHVGSKVVYIARSLLKDDGFTIIRRAWAYPPPFANYGTNVRQFWILQSGEKSVQIYAILGLEPEEAYATNVDKILTPDSRFFIKEDFYSCIISKSMRDRLGLKIGSTVYISGIPLSVIGVYDDELFNGIKDLDGAILSPIDFTRVRITLAGSPLTPEMMKVMSLEYRTASEFLLIVPYKLTREVFNAPIYSVAIMAPKEKLLSVVEELPLVQYALTSFLGDTVEKTTKLYSASLLIISRGWESVSLPMFITFLMILNLMLGATYERIKELTTLGTIGLSPIHTASLLIVEGLLYGVVGTVLGYIPGIIGCRMLLSLGIVPEGFVPGFASAYILIVTGLITAMLLAAAAYPASQASKMVTPSIIRRFKLTTRTVGDTLEISLPFFATEEDVYALLGYLAEYIDSCQVEGVGPFIAMGFSKFASEVSGFTKRVILESNMRLPPYDANITQIARVIASSEVGMNRYNIALLVKLVTGSSDTWRNSVGNFVGELRNQLLLWATLSSEERAKYMKIGESIRRSLMSEEE